MIDTTKEHLLPVRDVPKLLPRRPNGRRLHISAVYRWIQRGVGGVRLEAVKIGGTTYTSREALERFAQQRSGDFADPGQRSPSPPRTRERRREQARRRVEEILSNSRKGREG